MKNLFIYTIISFGILMNIFSCKNNGNDTKTEIQKGSLPAVLISDTVNSASCVLLTSDEKDAPVISWVEIDSLKRPLFYMAYWEQEKDRFSDPVLVPTPSNTSVHEEGMPKLAFKEDGSIIAVFETSTPIPNARFGQGDVQFSQSNDRGKTWTTPKSVYKNRPEKASISFSGISRLGNGEIGVAWLGTSDPSQEGRPVMFAQTKNGDGFQDPVTIDQSACECCRVAIASDTSGIISIAYRDLLPGSIRDITIRNSYDGGKNFENLEGITHDLWEINGCPHNGPAILRDIETTFLTWSTGGKNPGVHYAEYNNKGDETNRKYLSSQARFIQLCLLPNGTRMVAYDESHMEKDTLYSRIVLNKIVGAQHLEQEITIPNSHSNYPVLRPIDDASILVAWKENNNSVYYRKILVDEIVTSANEEVLFMPDFIKNNN